MQIKSLKLHNFRCFEDLTVELHPQCNVLVGANGAGKSAILDAVAIALGSYLAGIDGVTGNSISQDDVHYKMYLNGSSANREQQFPTAIAVEACVGEHTSMKWARELHSSAGRTTVKSAKAIMDYAQQIQKNTRSGSTDMILPLIAYYGTGRLWAKKQGRKVMSLSRQKPESRLKGYQDCLLPTANEKMMLDWFFKMTLLRIQEEKEIPELSVVERAMAECYKGMVPDAKMVRIRYSVKYNELEIQSVAADDTVEYLPLHLMSDGIRTILNLVADIAYRMAVLNPHLLDNILTETTGIVLIDEIDMHLHPAWQKRIVNDLCRVFPKLQFIVTTHAPSVLVNVHNEQIRVVEQHHVYIPERKTYGRNVQAVMEELMQVKVRPQEVMDELIAFNDLLDAGNLAGAEELLQQLQHVLGSDDQDVIEGQIALDMERV